MSAALTRAQLEAYVQAELQDTTEARWTLAQIRSFLNYAMDEWCRRTCARRGAVTVDVEALEPDIDLSTITPPVIKVLACYLPVSEGSTDEFLLKEYSIDEIARINPNWRVQRGQPLGYLRFEAGSLGLRLYPTPLTAFATSALGGGEFIFDSLYGDIDDMSGITDSEFNTLYGDIQAASDLYGALRVYYAQGSTDMAASSDTPLSKSEIPPEDHRALGDYAVARCMMMNTSSQQNARALVYMARFEDVIAKRSELVTNDFQASQKRAVRPRFF